MTSAPSPQGRRILVAVVTGPAGEAIQAWRRVHDPREAYRLPPHATLCYWAPHAAFRDLEKQVRHAFPRALDIRLGGVRKGANDQGTLFIDILDQQELDAAIHLLYDGAHVQFPELEEWKWHITVVRDSRGRDAAALMQAAAELRIPGRWRLDMIACLELRGDRYDPLATWRLDPPRAH